MKIYIASHNHRELLSDAVYQPLYVGAHQLPLSNRKASWEYDDTGIDNISSKNKHFCELTGMHWIWKQTHDDIKGLVHYRRYLGHPEKCGQVDTRLTEPEIATYLQKYDCLVARRERLVVNNQAASIAYHYRYLHSSDDLQQARMAIKKIQPEYLSAFDSVMTDTSFSPCNILIAPKQLFDSYAKWLFSIMDELERRIDPINYRDQYQQRVFGFLAERLLGIYLSKNQKRALECNLIDESGKPVCPCSTKFPVHIPHTQNTPRIRPIINGVDYSAVFDCNFYLNHYGDIADFYHDNPTNCIQHYLAIGINEGHVAHPHFSIRSYINGNPQLRKRFGADALNYVHYYITHPWDRARAVGFENMVVTEGTVPVDSTGSPLRKLDRLRYAAYRYLAEHIPLID